MSKKILSIDVGIKNLAFCLLEINEENKTIIKWDVIDLTKTQTENSYNISCSCLKIINKLKKEKIEKEVCNNISKFTKNGIYYCLKHAKKTDLLFPSNNLNLDLF